MSGDNTVIKGKYINVEEYPTGCCIHDIDRGGVVTIGDLEDINLVIESLQRLKKDWYSE